MFLSYTEGMFITTKYLKAHEFCKEWRRTQEINEKYRFQVSLFEIGLAKIKL